MTRPEIKTRTYGDAGRAEDAIRRWNRERTNATAVCVEGPGEHETTVMPLRDAVAYGFFYRWVA